jgi:hypothetical protein
MATSAADLVRCAFQMPWAYGRPLDGRPLTAAQPAALDRQQFSCASAEQGAAFDAGKGRSILRFSPVDRWDPLLRTAASHISGRQRGRRVVVGTKCTYEISFSYLPCELKMSPPTMVLYT